MSHHSSSESALIIAAHNLHKTFGTFHALNGLNLSVKKGEVLGFLGPNGAGKSTTIRVILGLLQKSSGSIELFGRDPWDNSVELHRRLAYVPGDVNLWSSLSGGEVIDLLGALRGGLDQKRRKQLIERFSLDPTKKCGTYSKGNRQKVAIVAALASDVELYIMDEPTSGLDPLMQAVFNDEVASLKKAGKTVLLSSHVLGEVEALCDRVTIIKEGKDIETGTLSEMRRLTRTSVEVHTHKPITGLEALKGLHEINVKGTHATMKVETHQVDALLRHLGDFTITSITCAPPSLEELFLHFYGTQPVNKEQ